MRDDSELLRLYAYEDSNEAFAELVHRHIRSVYAVAVRRVGYDANLAEEITQEVFADLARKSASLVGRKTLIGWLFVAARYASANAVRRAQQQQSLLRSAQQMTERVINSGHEPVWEEIRPVLDDAIHKLNERDREAILLYFFENRSLESVGSKLSITENGARMRIERALEKLRCSLGRRGITSTAAALTVALGSQAVAAIPEGLAGTVTAAALSGSVQPGTAAVLYLMSITKTQLGAAIAVILAGATILGLAQHKEILQLQSDRTALLNESAAKAERINELASKLAKNEAARAAARVQQPTSKGAGAGVGAAAALDKLYANNPKLMQLWLQDQMLKTNSRYRPLFIKLGLTAEQIAAFDKIKAEYAQAVSDVTQAAEGQGLSKTNPGLAAIAQQSQDEERLELLNLLGTTGYQQLSNYDSTSELRGLANMLATEVYPTESPLTAAQADGLTSILAATTSTNSSGKYVGPLNWDAIMPQAQQLLSASQYAALQQIQQKIEIESQMAAMSQQAQSRTPSPPNAGESN